MSIKAHIASHAFHSIANKIHDKDFIAIPKKNKQQGAGQYLKTEIFEKKSEYAPGLPDKNVVDKIDQKGLTRMVIQQHKATNDHFDMRIKDGDKAHSWVIRSMPGEKTTQLAIRQPTHTAKYMDFEGEIKEGYGKGGVKKVYDEEIDVVYGHDKKVKVVLPQGEFTMLKIDKLGPNNWLMVKNNPIKDPITYKPKYKDATSNKKEIDLNDDTKILEPKIDGAHTLFELRKGRESNRIYSYRTSKSDNRPIDHTHQVPDLREVYVPEELDGTVLRGELYANTRDHNKPMPSEQVSGLLNASVIKSRRDQDLKGKLKAYIFDVVKHKGENVENADYATKLKIIESVGKKLPMFRPAEVARTAEEKKNMLNSIKNKQHPDTQEGVVEWSLNEPGGDPKKLKLRDTHEVVVRSIYPAISKRDEKFAGGFKYSWKPESAIVGSVGTGFTKKLRDDMLNNPENYIGRTARVKTQQIFESGAMRAPAFYAMHIEKNLEKTARSFTAKRNKQYWQMLKKLHGGSDKAVKNIIATKSSGIYHYTKPENVKSILKGNLVKDSNSFALFGHGNYFGTKSIIKEGPSRSVIKFKKPSELSGKTLYPKSSSYIKQDYIAESGKANYKVNPKTATKAQREELRTSIGSWAPGYEGAKDQFHIRKDIPGHLLKSKGISIKGMFRRLGILK